jgi:hypothetical protein
MAQIYKNITEDDRSFISQESTTGLWTGDTASLSTFYTSDTQIAKANSKYFIDVYNSDPATTSSAAVQFSIGYGNRFGSGSPTLTQQNTSTRSAQAVYLQLKNLLLEPTDTQFTFAGTSATSDQVYAIVVARSRYKGYVDSGNWELSLSGSKGIFKFIDDSSQTLGTKRSFAKNGLVFNVASGSLTGTQGSTIAGITSSTAPNAGKGFGLFYPQKGVIVLNTNVITTHVGLADRTGSLGRTAATDHATGENTASAAIFISQSSGPGSLPRAPFTGSLVGTGGVYQDQFNWHGLYRSLVLGGSFTARSAEIISSNHYFLRLNNREFNYSNNPTFATGSNGQLANQDFENDPKVYVTTVGLYNASNELLAVAKLSRPLEKSFSKEALLRVRLDF